MLFTAISALALAFTGVHGYQNTSPFFLYSTTDIPDLPTIAQLTPASSIQNLFSQALGSCPTKKYAVILQPGVSSDDYQCTRSTPFLFKLGTSGPGVTKGMFKDVIGPVYHVGLVNTILMDCLHHGIKSVKTLDTSALMLPELDAQTISENVIWAPMPAIEPHLTKEERKVVMRNHDMYIEGLVENYFGGEDYTLFYVTESRHDAEVKHNNFEGQEYQMESEVPLVAHGDLGKRALSVLKNDTGSSNQTIVDGPLFDKYQFFSPGIFMGLFVAFILLSLAYTGISALASLQVTYGAFDKEQGQLAGKK